MSLRFISGTRSGRYLVAALVVGLVVALLAGGWRMARGQEARTLSISGQVVNGTGGSVLPAGLKITLHAFDRADRPILNVETASDEKGRFQFDGVALTEGVSYALNVSYSGVRYSMLLDPALPLDQVRLKVYEATPDVSVVVVKQQVLIIADVDKRGREIAALEFIQLSNKSDRTLLPDLAGARTGQFSFLRFSLPPRATNLDVRSDLAAGEVVSIGTGFAISSLVFPGDHDISFSFRFPYQAGRVSYRQSFPQGAEVYQVLLPQWLSRVQIAPLQLMPEVRMGDSVYQVWERRDLRPGEVLSLELTHLPQPGLLSRMGVWASNGTFWQVSIPSVVGATLAFLLLYSAFKSHRGATGP